MLRRLGAVPLKALPVSTSQRLLVFRRPFWGSAFSATPPPQVIPPRQKEGDSRGQVANRKEFLSDVRGVPVSTSSWEALELLDLSIWNYARWSGDPINEAKLAGATDPSCILAHCVVAICLLAHQGAAPHHPQLLAAMKTNRRLLGSGSCGGEREMVHATAVEAWAEGQPRKAAAVWEAWLLKCPRDLLALRASHDALLACGDGLGMLESVARVRPMWDTGIHGYSHVLSMHAFALTEATGASSMGGVGSDTSEAEDMARAAFAKDKKDMWALHALSHVLEHGGRASEGASLLKHQRDTWEALPGVDAAVHLGSHFAKFYLERGNYKAGLRVVDTHVIDPLLHRKGAREYLGVRHNQVNTSFQNEEEEAIEALKLLPPPSALADATAMLWRMELSGVAAGFRWERVERLWESMAPPESTEGAGGAAGAIQDNGANEGKSQLMVAASLPVHRLTPLQAVHRTMSAITCAEIRAAVKEQKEKMREMAQSAQEAANEQEEERRENEEEDAATDGDSEKSAVSTLADATSSVAVAEMVSEVDVVKAEAESVAALVTAAGGEVTVVETVQADGLTTSYSVLDEFGDDVRELESGVHGMDLDFGGDYELARQRQLDEKFAAAAEEVALMVMEGNAPPPLEECFLPVALLSPPIEDDNDGDVDPWATAGEIERRTAARRSSIEHLFDNDDDDDDGVDDDDEVEGGGGSSRRRTRFIPSAPRAPFIRDPLGTEGRGIPEKMSQVAAMGVVCFWQRNLVGALDRLLPLKNSFDRLGGSVLDQETVYLTLLEAAVRSSAPASKNFPPEYHFGKPDLFDYVEFDGANDGVGGALSSECQPSGRRYGGVSGLVLARALLSERTALRTGSAQLWVRYAVVLERLGDHDAADMARKNAYAMGIGQGGKNSH